MSSGRRRVNQAARSAGAFHVGQTYSKTMTKQMYLRKREQERVESQQINDMRNTIAEQKRIAANLTSDDRVERMRRQRRLQHKNAELAQDRQLEEAMRKAREREILVVQERRLAEALKERNQRRAYEESTRQRLCAGDEEIKQLKRLIHEAQINKVRGNQVMERAMLAEQQKSEQLRLDAIMERERQNEIQRLADKDRKRREDLMEGKQYLDQQMAEREAAKARAYEEFLREKEEIDKIVEGVRQEERRKVEEHVKRREDIKKEIKQYLDDRRDWRRKEAERVAEELRKIKEYQRLQQQRAAQLAAQKAEKNAKREAALASVGAEIENQRRAQEEMEQILNDLYEEELKNKQEEEAMMRKERRERMKREMLEANEKQLAIKAERKAQADAEEMEFVNQMLAKFENDRRLEQMSKERRRREIANYKKEVDRLVQERRAMYEAQLAAQLAEMERERKQKEFEKQIVEEERLRLLDQYAKELKGYLPKGVMKSKSDYERIYGRKMR